MSSDSVLICLLVVLIHFSSSVLVSATLEDAQNVIDWISSLENGFFNDKQRLTLLDNGKMAMIADKPIPRGEMLLQVPWETMIVGEENPDEVGDLNCNLVHTLAQAMEDVTPYTHYLKNRKRHEIPSDFSDFGKEILMDILSYTPELPPSEPFSWLEDDWYGSCHGDASDESLKHAAMLSVQLQSNGVMVPVYDLYRHRNGPYYNTFVRWEPQEKGMQLYALKDIQEGEELHQSHNQCYDCDKELYKYYGAAGKCGLAWLTYKL